MPRSTSTKRSFGQSSRSSTEPAAPIGSDERNGSRPAWLGSGRRGAESCASWRARHRASLVRKCRRAVKTIAAPAFSTASITSSSRREPPGWTIAVAPGVERDAAARRGRGRTRPTRAPSPRRRGRSDAAFSTAIRTASTRLIWPAPMPIVARSFTSTIAFEETCLQTRQAKTRSPHCALVGRAGDDLPALAILDLGVGILDEHAAEHALVVAQVDVVARRSWSTRMRVFCLR